MKVLISSSERIEKMAARKPKIFLATKNKDAKTPKPRISDGSRKTCAEMPNSLNAKLCIQMINGGWSTKGSKIPGER